MDPPIKLSCDILEFAAAGHHLHKGIELAPIQYYGGSSVSASDFDFQLSSQMLELAIPGPGIPESNHLVLYRTPSLILFAESRSNSRHYSSP